MSSIVCPWCEAVVTGHPGICPDCGTDLTRRLRAAAPSPPTHHRHHLFWWILSTLLVVCAIVLPALVLTRRSGILSQKAFHEPLKLQIRYQSPAFEEVLLNGEQAVEQTLAASGGKILSDSVRASAEDLLTVCGHADLGQGRGTSRFLSLWGAPATTVYEISDPDFPVLWARLCPKSSAS